jgi:hypothetical protein
VKPLFGGVEREWLLVSTTGGMPWWLHFFREAQALSGVLSSTADCCIRQSLPLRRRVMQKTAIQRQACFLSYAPAFFGRLMACDK